MIRWIQERQYAQYDQYDHSRWKTCNDFIQVLDELGQDEQVLIEPISELILRSDTGGKELFGILKQQITAENVNTDMMVTLGCALALGKSPEIHTWKKIKKIAWYSWEIQHWLSEAMHAYALQHEKFRLAYIRLINDIFFALESHELKSESDKRNEERDNVRNYLNQTEIKLEELLEGLRGADFMNYEEEMRLFGLLSDIDFDHFQSLLPRSGNPLLIDSMLLGSGIGIFNPQFSKWAESVKKTPVSFNSDGTWSGSVLLPLLLMHARSHLLNPGKQVPQHGANEQEVAVLTAQVNELVQAVVDTLLERTDARGLLSRWSIWLMKQIIPQRETKFEDIRAYNFIDNALIMTIGRKINGMVIDTPPHNADAWEEWCLYCVKSLFASEGLSDAPDFALISCSWKLKPEEWHQERGRHLLSLASLHLPRDKMPNFSAYLLAWSLSSQSDFPSRWKLAWDDASVLREVLEFGSGDIVKNVYSDRGDASNLLLLLVCIGVACLDHCVNRLSETNKPAPVNIFSLYHSLSEAVIEMLYIDNTIYRDRWKLLLKSLALRRTVWDSSFVSSQDKSVFTSDVKPDTEFWLQFLKTDNGDLIAYLFDCLNNGVEEDKLSYALINSSVDLDNIVRNQRRLSSLRESHYKIDSRALKTINKLIVRQ